MILRPQMQLRYRDEAQFVLVQDRAKSEHLSVNEWVLGAVETRLGVTPRATAPGQVDFGAQGSLEKNRRAASPPLVKKLRAPAIRDASSPIADRSFELGIPVEACSLLPADVVTKARQGGSTISMLKLKPRSAGLSTLVASGAFDKSSALEQNDGIPAEIMGLQPTVADTYGGIARGAGPGIPSDPDTTSWTEEQWWEYEETHRIDPATGGQYPNKEFCELRKTDSCDRYNTGGHCLRCR